MPAQRLSMRRIKEVLRLKNVQGLSERVIAVHVCDDEQHITRHECLAEIARDARLQFGCEHSASIGAFF